MLPLVGSTITEPGSIRPSRSAASSIATPRRSLTDPPGFRNSSFATISPPSPSPSRPSATSGVPPTSAETSPLTLKAAPCPGAPAMPSNYQFLTRIHGIRRPGVVLRARTALRMQRLRLTPGSDDEAAGRFDAYLEAEPEAAEDRARAAAAWVQATSSVDPFLLPCLHQRAFRRPYPMKRHRGLKWVRVNVPGGGLRSPLVRAEPSRRCCGRNRKVRPQTRGRRS